MKSFVRNLSYVTVSTFWVAAAMMIVQIVAGRIMGPDEYGKYALVESIGSILVLVGSFGFHTSSVHFLAKDDDKKKILSASAAGFFFNLLVVFLLAWLTLPLWADFFKVGHPVAIFSLLYMIFFSLQQMARSLMRGFNYMKQFAVYDSISTLIALAGFYFLIRYTGHNFNLIANTKFLAFGGFSLLVLYLIKDKFVRFKISDLKELYVYGALAFFGGIGTLILTSADRLVVNYYLGAYSAGLYYAYVIASQAITFQLLKSFLIIFFPASSRAEDKKALYTKMNLAYKKFGIPFFVFNILTTLGIFAFYGHGYPFSFGLIILFSANSFISSIQQIDMWLLNAFGHKGIKNSAVLMLAGALIFILLSILSVKIFGITGVIVSMIATNILLALVQRIRIKKLVS